MESNGKTTRMMVLIGLRPGLNYRWWKIVCYCLPLIQALHGSFLMFLRR